MMGLQVLNSIKLLKRAALLGKIHKNSILTPCHSSSLHNVSSVNLLVPSPNKVFYAGALNSKCSGICSTAVHNFYASGTSLNDSTHNASSDSSDQDGQEENEGKEAYSSVEDIREAVLDAALKFVNELGWTEEAIAKGAESLGYSPMAHGLVEGGGAELFCWLQRRLNEQLEQRLVYLCKLEKGSSTESKRAMVETALRYRLEQLLPYSPVYAKGMAAVVLSPTHVAASVQATAQLADHICHYTGRTSPDAGWYTSRVAVGAVYKMTELCLLQDQSPEYQDTWQFLHRRVQELEGCEGAGAKLQSVIESSASVARAAVLTGLNILGLNHMSR